MAFRALSDVGVAAIFEESAGGGDLDAASSPRNAPVASPETHLSQVKFSTALDNLEVVSDTVVTIAHGAGSAISLGAFTGADPADQVQFNSASVDRLLVTHGLGYIPDVLVAFGNNMLWPGMPVQTASDGRGRYCAPYVTTTQVRLWEWLSASAATLAAINIDYRVIVFRQPRAASGDDLFAYDPATGVLKLGYDRFSSDRRYLQVVAGGSPFAIFNGPCADIANGAPRFIRPDGTSFDPVPSTMKCRLDSHVSYGASMAYNGAFAGSASVQVQAP